MKNKCHSHLRKIVGLGVLLAVAPLMLPALGQRKPASFPAGGAGTDYELSWHTIAGGGAMRGAGGTFELSGTIGQSDAGMITGGTFDLSGGFWFAVAPTDCNEDGGVNLLDYETFVICLTGPDSGVVSGCECYDVNRSGTVDMRDLRSCRLPSRDRRHALAGVRR
jgi:hypothetical protein